jgi:hypothetical protein
VPIHFQLRCKVVRDYAAASAELFALQDRCELSAGSYHFPLDSVINAGVGTLRVRIPLSIPLTVLGCARSYAPDVRSFFPSRCENQLASEIADLCHIKWPALFADDRTATTAWHERRGRVASDPRRPWSSDGILFDLLRDSGERE